MKRHIALLRGINVGGRNRLPMADLVSIFESLGHRDVRTVGQTGNVVFGARGPSAPSEADTVAALVAERHGFRPHVRILSEGALRTAIDRNPFPTGDGKALHLFFLESTPTSVDHDEIERARKPSERFVLDRDVFYLYAPDGFARSKLATSVERYVGVAATARNWNTVTKLEAMLDRT